MSIINNLGHLNTKINKANRHFSITVAAEFSTSDAKCINIKCKVFFLKTRESKNPLHLET